MNQACLFKSQNHGKANQQVSAAGGTYDPDTGVLINHVGMTQTPTAKALIMSAHTSMQE